ncbi:alpha-glucosidase [Nonomuraea sp. NPDC049480]|uniref:alpha-glucosidase n=1 Tax=Nonomuraea sp. NPDC049480 TaxID=3364353 RepID=UPI00379D9CF6
MTWWRNAIVYQIYPRSFADSNGDGVGDLRGIVEHIDHLTELGVDVVWLSPVYPSPHDDNGYDISNYQDIDPVFGTLDDFDTLVETLHRNGIRLVMDLVVNHTSDEHPWFAESRASRDSPQRDWYWWRPPRPGMTPGTPGAEPTNWVSYFGGPAWEFDEATGEYYLHLFTRKQPDLNWENPEVRAAVHDVMRWWLARGVDGFRMDVINMISKDPSLPDGQPGTAGAAQGLLADGRPHFICGPRLHEFLREMHDSVFARHPAQLLTVGETPGISHEEGRLLTDPARRELDMVFQFEHVTLDCGQTKWDRRQLDLRELKASFARWQNGLGDGWNSLYWDNHDQPRAVSRFGDDDPEYRERSAKLLAAVLHLHRGTPYIYQGEELGMTNVPFSHIDDFRDIESLNHYRHAVASGADPDDVLDALRSRSRDNARTPVQWTNGRHTGFTTGTPWLPVNPNHTEINAADQRKDPDSVFHFHRRLIALRHTESVVVDGDYTLLLPQDEQVWAFTRRLDSTELLVLANLSRDHVAPALDPTPWAHADTLLTNYPDAGQPPSPFRLRPWEVVVYRRVVVAGS